MPSKSAEPSATLVSFNCPHCSSYAQQSWMLLYAEGLGNNPPYSNEVSATERVTPIQGGAIGHRAAAEKAAIPARPEILFFAKEHPVRGDHLGRVLNVHLSYCNACRRFAAWIGGNVVHPPTRRGAEPNSDLPKDVLADYEEARSILSLSPRGAAALLRLAIQKLCKHLGGDGKNIDKDISSLVAKGLSPVVQKSLDIVRVIGNESVHPGTIDLRDTPEIANALFGLVNLIAEKMITEEKHVNALYESLPASKLAGIEQRDKPKETE